MMTLDTNVLSELMRKVPEKRVVDWLSLQPQAQLVITAITASEILYGIAKLAQGKRQMALRAAFTAMLDEDFQGRVIPFDHAAAIRYADVVSTRERIGRPIHMADAQIAAICLAHGSALVTRNTKDFSGIGLSVLNPWST
jgi:predicted nucleic acid-binding protein